MPSYSKTAGQGFIRPVQADCPDSLLSMARHREPMEMLVVRASAMLPMQAAFEAYSAGIARPVLVGERHIITAEAEKLGWDLTDIAIIEAEGEAEAASISAEILRQSLISERPPIGAVMKGQLHTDVFMAALLDKQIGLRTGGRLVHVFAIFPADSSARPILISDAALNVSPDEKTQNQSMMEMVRLSRLLGSARPKLAVLSATETPIASMPASVLAHDRALWARQNIPDCDISGPLSFDLALSEASVQLKGLADDKVAGQADCLLVPDIVSGNLLYKAFVYLGGGCAAGLVLGGAVPVLLTSRADSPQARLASIALAAVARGSSPL